MNYVKLMTDENLLSALQTCLTNLSTLRANVLSLHEIEDTEKLRDALAVTFRNEPVPLTAHSADALRLLLVRECWKDYITTVEYLSNYADKLTQVVNQLENGERAWALNELFTRCEPDAEPDFEPTNTGTLTDRQEKTADAS